LGGRGMIEAGKERQGVRLCGDIGRENRTEQNH